MNSNYDNSGEVKKMVHEAFKRSRDVFNESYRHLEIGAERTVRLNTFPFGDTGQTYAGFLEDHKDYAKLPSPGDFDDIILTIHNTLDYIRMSPDKAGEHKRTYVINKSMKTQVNIQSYLRNNENIILNSCEGELMQIFDFWLNKARQFANYKNVIPPKKMRLRQQSIFLVVGEPGIGKTALLNYVFSVRAKDMLDPKNNIMWIRVDLNDARDMRLGLKERLTSKFLRIFARYYAYNKHYQFDEKYFRDLYHYFVESFKDDTNGPRIKKQQFEYYIKNFFRMLKKIKEVEQNGQTFRVDHDYRAYDMSFDWVSSLTLAMMSHIQLKKKFGYIFIFDGLDSVTLDRIQYEVYRSWLTEIDSVVDNDKNKYKALYIVTMRDYSFIHFFFRVLHGRRRTGEEYVITRLQQMPLSTIISKKYDLALERMSEYQIKVTKVHLWNMKNNIVDIVNMCLYGLPAKEFSEQYVLDKSKKREEYDLIRLLFNNDYRAIMRFFRTLLLMLSNTLKPQTFNILSSGTGYEKCLRYLDGKEWAVYRVLIFGDCGEKAYSNRISYEINGDPRMKSKHNAVIPNIFNYKDKGMHIDDDVFPRVLLKLRVIQIMRRESYSTVFSVLDKLRVFYKCDYNLLRDDIREMIYNGLISPHVYQTEYLRADQKGYDYPVKLTEFSNNIFDRILKQSIFYEIVSDDTPIDKRFIDGIEPVNRYDSTKTREEYVMSKTRSVINFLLYLMKVEEAEKERYQRENNIGSYDDNEMNIFSKALIEDIKYTMQEYVYKLMVKTRDKRRFIDNWYNYFDIPR